MIETLQEQWKEIPDYPHYEVSDLGRIYSHIRDKIMAPSYTTFGHMKVCLRSPWDHHRVTKGVALLVAEAFVEAPTEECNYVIILDGDFTHVAARNLMWRPRWMVHRYTRQLKVEQPINFQNLPCVNIVTGVRYRNVIEAGMTEGLLFKDIWFSTYTGQELFPNGAIFEIVK